MSRRSITSRVATWAAIAALLLRAAAPMLATAAAHLRGVPVGELCEVYGIAPGTLAMAGHAHHQAGHIHHGQGSAPDHGCDEHCALTALAALGALPDMVSGGSAVALSHPAGGAGDVAPWHVHDPCAAWAAGLAHGPPRPA